MTAKRIGVLASEYPAASHTFIRREVAALRRIGFEVSTYSVRAASPDPGSPQDRRAADTTFSVLPIRAAALLRAHLALVASRPVLYGRTLALACRHRLPGLRNALWALFHFAEAGLLAARLGRDRIEHLHTHFSNSGGTVGMLAARLARIRWSLTLHGPADFDAPTRPLIPEKVDHAEFAICISAFGRSQALFVCRPDQWGKIHVSRCGLESPERMRRVREPENPRVRLLNVGRLAPAKGQLGLVEALAALVSRGVDAELRIVGEGPERGALEASIREHGLEERCILLGGAPEEVVLSEMADADLFVLSSFAEGLPVVLMEAMAVGLPVTAPHLAGIPELVEDRVTGRLYVAGRWDQLADVLEELARDPEQRRKLAKAGGERVREQHAIDVSVRPLAALLARESGG
ncbi:MAG: glycosyltransferase family 4 protein [Deltaproteobacteria bacterium]|nr:glycosyltransferase family 4 protein [Deltaproteobacteria bacterium]